MVCEILALKNTIAKNKELDVWIKQTIRQSWVKKKKIMNWKIDQKKIITGT